MTAADFKAAMPAFSSIDDETINRWLADASSEFDVARWDVDYTKGLRNWVAYHIVEEAKQVVAGPGGGGLIAVEKQVGTERIRFSEAAITAAMTDPFMANVYGREYRRLARLVGAGAVAV